MHENEKNLVHQVRHLNELGSKLLLQAIRYSAPGGCDVDAIEQEIRKIGQALDEEAGILKHWKG